MRSMMDLGNLQNVKDITIPKFSYFKSTSIKIVDTFNMIKLRKDFVF